MAGTPVRKVPYKDFLQPVLQRRFSSTAAVLLVVSYLEAVFFASWNSYFWAWFPLGPATVRTLLIFACGLPILVLRIAHYHVGLRTTSSGGEALVVSLASLSTYETAFWYLLSSSLFSPIFLLSAPQSSNLQWINVQSGDRARLNERPLFLVCYLGTCALVQTACHYARDTDRLVMGSFSKTASEKQPDTVRPPNPIQSVLTRMPVVLNDSVTRAAASLVATFAIYYLALRPFVWSWTISILRLFYNLPKSNMVPHYWPVDLYFLSRCLYAGTLLFVAWEAGNTAFSIFMVKPPLKNGKPLTSESKDPNSSLLNGLKSKKQSVKAFALWELAYVAKDFDTRRQAIYQDIDRKDGPMWSQVYAICIDLVKSVETRIDNYNKPAKPPPVEEKPAQPKQRVSAPLRDDPVLRNKARSNTARDGMEKAVSQIARSPGASPVSKLSPLAKKTWNEAKDRLLSRSQQEAMSPEHLRSQLEQRAGGLMNTWLVRMFIQRSFRTEFAAAVLGGPYAEPAMHINAIIALTQLAIHSLAEDQFGNVHRDVPSIVRSLTALVKKLDAFKQRFPSHWMEAKGDRDTPEIDEILEAARAGLSAVVAGFEPYMTDLRLSLTDLRLAKEAAVKPQQQPEMRQETIRPAQNSNRDKPAAGQVAASSKRREARA